MPLPRLLPSFAMLALLAACTGYPRDPDGTLERVRGGTLRVGVIHDPPFVVASGRGEPAGREADLLRGFARTLDARIQWRHAGAGALMRQLQERRLDAVIGGHVDDSPWAAHVSLARPFAIRDGTGRTVRRSVALPPGENAWQVAFERHAASPAARARLEGGTR